MKGCNPVSRCKFCRELDIREKTNSPSKGERGLDFSCALCPGCRCFPVSCCALASAFLGLSSWDPAVQLAQGLGLPALPAPWPRGEGKGGFPTRVSSLRVTPGNSPVLRAAVLLGVQMQIREQCLPLPPAPHLTLSGGVSIHRVPTLSCSLCWCPCSPDGSQPRCGCVCQGPTSCDRCPATGAQLQEGLRVTQLSVPGRLLLWEIN